MRVKERMHACQLAITVVAVLFGCPRTPGQTGTIRTPETNSYVQVIVSLSRETFRPGQAGALQVTFHPEDDIHITAEPPVRISLASTRIVSLSGSPEMEVDTSTGYLVTRTPAAQRFTVSKQIRKGTYTVKGSLVYFYCSDSEGWCRKKVEPLTVVLTVAP